jgi:Amt family ammonium transporter
MLWVGWFGFNAGSMCTAGAGAGMALLTTHIAGAAAGGTYMLLEWWKVRKPSTLGIATGAVAGLVAITPACGFVGPLGALVIGVVAAAASFLAITKLKRIAGYDDSLDVFGVHGVGGLVGTILTGVFGAAMLGGQKAGLDIGLQTWIQVKCAVITVLWSGIGTAVILIALDKVMGLRVGENVEFGGLDVALHGEAAYNN